MYYISLNIAISFNLFLSFDSQTKYLFVGIVCFALRCKVCTIISLISSSVSFSGTALEVSDIWNIVQPPIVWCTITNFITLRYSNFYRFSRALRAGLPFLQVTGRNNTLSKCFQTTKHQSIRSNYNQRNFYLNAFNSIT